MEPAALLSIPVMGRWIQDFQQSHPNVQINYQIHRKWRRDSAGEVGHELILAPRMRRCRTQDLAQMTPVIQIPESAGPICVTYNLDGLQKPLQLSSDALAGIFLGKITSWQDPICSRRTIRARSCPTRRSPWFTAPKAAAPQLRSLLIFPQSARIGHNRSAKARLSNGQRDLAPRAARGLLAR